jgi:hypothetical protein
LPVIVHSVCGWVASVTSASTVDEDEPCITTSASWADGWPVQFADIEAHDGTAAMLGSGDGDGLGLGVGLGLALGDAEADGLVFTATLDAEPHPDRPTTPTITSNAALRPTGRENVSGWLGVTNRRATGVQEYGRMPCLMSRQLTTPGELSPWSETHAVAHPSANGLVIRLDG